MLADFDEDVFYVNDLFYHFWMMHDDFEYLGKCWAVIMNGKVIKSISMVVPDDVDFPKYQEKAISCLSMLGEVIEGFIVKINGERNFISKRKEISIEEVTPLSKLIDFTVERDAEGYAFANVTLDGEESQRFKISKDVMGKLKAKLDEVKSKK
jgi:hypothetical protein